jgi:hypothetical protein
MNSSDSSYNDRKHIRRDNITKKKHKNHNREDIDGRDVNKIKKAFKHKKTELFQEELWEEWQDEIS